MIQCLKTIVYAFISINFGKLAINYSLAIYV